MLEGFFVNSDFVVFAIINGSMFETEAVGPLVDLEPGYYDENLRPMDSPRRAPERGITQEQ